MVGRNTAVVVAVLLSIEEAMRETEEVSLSDQPELTPVRKQHRFDEQRLAKYLQGRLDRNFSDLSVLQFEGGQSNPTFQLSADGRKYVLRKKPPGQLLKSAHQIDREYRVMTALRDTAVPVPKTYHLCEDDAVLGTAFFVMENVEGRVLVDPSLPSMSKDDRHALYDHFIEILAALHAIDLDAVGLSDFGRAGNYYERQISRWSKQYRASETEHIPEMEALMKWLPKNIPQTEELTLVHGDYRVANCIVHPTEPRIVALLDWELSTTGHPLADVGYSCMMYHGWGTLANRDFGHDASGIPSEQEFLDGYSACAGIGPIENWTFYIVYNLFRFGGIVQGVYKRGLDGNASSEQWKERGDQCRAHAESAWSLVQAAEKGSR